MGCGDSRPQPGDEMPPGLLPFRRRMQELKRYRVEDLRRRRKERKDSVVSVADLLHPEEANAMEEEPGRKAEEEEEDVRRIRRERTVAEELPGSPSFRFYLTEPGKAAHGGPVLSNHQGQEKLNEEKEMINEISRTAESVTSGKIELMNQTE